ncbi:MAG: DUF2779 domain-containing protein [Eubacteriales bacterium]
MNISKSRYVSYCQCPKKLWLEINRPELADIMDQTAFKNGTLVGELAQGLFPGGTVVKFDANDPKNIENMILSTKKLIAENKDFIYEAAFGTEGLLAICDVLVRVESSNNDDCQDANILYDIYEVKSSTKLKEVYLKDVAFQQYVLGACGVKVRDTYVVYINNQYVRNGELDIQSLFIIEKVTELTTAMQNDIIGTLPDVFNLLEMDDEPLYDIGLQCSEPYVCQFETYCWAHIPEISVFNINNLSKIKKFDYYANGIISFEDLRDHNISLNESQRIQLEADLEKVVTINRKAITSFLDSLSFPLYFLDFETFMPPVPLYDGTRPYQQIPSQYSLHYLDSPGGKLEHREFLAQEGLDPRPSLVKRLVEDIPAFACVLAYNMAFEKGIIKNLAESFPAQREVLMSIHDNIKDLMEPFKSKHYYTKDMQGSFSIKYVLPALFPDDEDLSYHNLDLIHDGNEAMNAYAALTELSEDERLKVRQSLLEYCKLDTLAMVKIWEKLNELIKA